VGGLSWYSAGGGGALNFGVLIGGDSSLDTTSGNVSLRGDVRGTYTNGAGVVLGNAPSGTTTGNVLLSTTSGNISITGIGYDAANNVSGWRHGVLVTAKNANEQTTVKTTSGTITIDGQATFTTAVTDSSGLQLQNGLSNSVVSVVSQSGAINLRGSNTKESTQYLNGIRITAMTVRTATQATFS
jgi:formylmethanofuran dehydrogenase subunit C